MKTIKLSVGLYKLEYKDFNFGVVGGNGGCSYSRWQWVDLTEDEESTIYFTTKKEALIKLKMFLDLKGEERNNAIYNCFPEKYYYDKRMF